MQLSKYIDLVKALKQTLDVPEIMGTMLTTIVNEYVRESNELATRKSNEEEPFHPHTRMFIYTSECNRIWRTLAIRELKTGDEGADQVTLQMFENVLPHILGDVQFQAWKQYHHLMLVLN